MKRTTVKLIALLLFVPAALLSFSGCASTPTSASTGQYIDDTAITAKVKSALLADDRVSGLAVNVETFKGSVQLSGFVDTATQKQVAEELAGQVDGVQRVVNNITVK